MEVRPEQTGNDRPGSVKRASYPRPLPSEGRATTGYSPGPKEIAHARAHPAALPRSPPDAVPHAVTKILVLRDMFNGDLWGMTICGDALRHGHLALWWSGQGCGVPIAANPYVGAFYPPNWLFAVFAPETALRLWPVFHVSVAAMSVYALTRHWKLAIAPSLLAAISFAFSTFVIAYLEFAQSIRCFVWMPPLLLSVSAIIERTAEFHAGVSLGNLLRRNCGAMAGLAAVVALQFVTSGEIFYYSVCFVAAYGICRWATFRNLRVVALSMLQLALSAGLGFAIATPFALLVLELLPYSNRAGEMDALMSTDSAHPWQWLSFFIPFLFGKPGYPSAYWARQIYEFAIGTCYVGVLPLFSFLFTASYFNKRRDCADRRFLVCFFVGAALVALLMAAGNCTPVYALVHHFVPGFRLFRYPTKAFLFLAFSFSILGALGFQALLECRTSGQRLIKKWAWWVAFGLFALLSFGFILSLLHPPFLLWLMASPAKSTPEQIHAVSRDFLLAAFFSGVGVALLGLLAFQKRTLRWLPAVIIALGFINLWIISRQTQIVLPSGIYTNYSTALEKRLGADPLYRVRSLYSAVPEYIYGETRPAMLNWARETGGATADWARFGINGVVPGSFGAKRYDILYGIFNSHSEMAVQNKAADLLSIRQTVSGPEFFDVLWSGASKEFTVTVRPSALPRAFLATKWRVVPDGDSAFGTLFNLDFDPHAEAVVESLPGEPDPEPLFFDTGRSPIGPVTSLVHSQEKLVIEASAARRSLLVLGDSWYPGWTATVDGKKKPIYRANYLFRGVFLEPGKHHIEFSFMPAHLHLGIWIGVISAMVCLAMALSPWRFKP